MSVLSKLRYPLYPLYEARLKRELRGKKRPKHIAVMADGNRRWAVSYTHLTLPTKA